MQNLLLYQVDAFTDQLFRGNPAAVVPLATFPDEQLMQSIASENNLSETAFVVAKGEGAFFIRWFTPTQEVRLCGHATLAAAHVLFAAAGNTLETLHFTTVSAGELRVRKIGDRSYAMDFPLDSVRKARAPRFLANALKCQPKAVLAGTDDLLVILETTSQVRRLQPQFDLLAKIKKRGIIVTAPGKDCDFVSRCFYPAYGILEDPVTGSAHTLLAAYWSDRLGKKELQAKQLSKRGGNIRCEVEAPVVRLIGDAITYLSGEIRLAD